MAPGPSNVDRVYRALKHRILSGSYSLGSRIDTQSVADDYGTSVTPVRDAVQRLIGERLLEALPHGGFQAPAVTAPALLDLYDWNGRLAQIAAKLPPCANEPLAQLVDALAPMASPEQFAALTASLYSHLARRSGNQAHQLAVAQLNDSLHAARLAEARTLKDPYSELLQLIRTLDSGNNRAISTRLSAYHHRRRQKLLPLLATIHSFHERQR